MDFVEWSGAPVPSGPTGPPANWSTANYTYDPTGRRIEKNVDGFITRYAYDGGNVIGEYAENGDLLRKYLYGPGIDEPISMTEVVDSNAVYYYHTDGLGSVIALTDATGNSVQTYEYSIYGLGAASDPNHTNPYMFAGRRFDVETGLYYNRARYYNPYIGRFMQTDPIGYGDGMSWYAYTGNNPVNFVDPTGSYVHHLGIGFPIMPYPRSPPDLSPDAPWFMPNPGRPQYPVRDGKKWNALDFFGWYCHGPAKNDVTLMGIGLFEDFKNHDQIRTRIERRKRQAVFKAKEFAKQIQNSGPFDPQYYSDYYRDPIEYDFAPPGSGGRKWLGFKSLVWDRFIVLGAGTVDVEVYISAIASDNGVTWSVFIQFWFDDDFADPSRVDDTPNQDEWEGCSSYNISQRWYYESSGFLSGR